VTNANVTAWDNNSIQAFTALTASSGWIIRQEVQDYWQTSNQTYTYSNYTINASKSGFTTNTTQVNLTTNTIIYLIITSLGQVTNCSTYKCFILRTSGTAVAIFDALGAVDINGSLLESASGSPDTNDFIIRNSTGATVAWIDDATGNFSLIGTISENNGVACNPPNGSFFIRGNNSECVAYINSTGDLWLRGELQENAFS